MYSKCKGQNRVLSEKLYFLVKNFRAKRLQGTNLFIQASSLETDIESSYMTNGNIFAERGNLNIKNLHGSTYLHLLKGNLSVSK